MGVKAGPGGLGNDNNNTNNSNNDNSDITYNDTVRANGLGYLPASPPMLHGDGPTMQLHRRGETSIPGRVRHLCLNSYRF